jgi:hypothetical protein
MVNRIPSSRAQVVAQPPREKASSSGHTSFQLAPARASPAPAARASLPEPPLQRVAGAIERQRVEIDRAIRDAARGRSFSPAEILVLQARVFAYAQNLEVLSQVVDKSVGAVKTALNTQL